MQAVPQVLEAAVQAAGLTAPTVDVAVQAHVQRHPHQPPQHGAAEALLGAPLTVKDLFCPDREFWAEQERDRDEREKQQKEHRKKDLESIQKMLDQSFSFNIK